MNKFLPVVSSLVIAGAAFAQVPAGKPAEATARSGKNIVEVAVSAGNFQTLVAAVKAAGLVDTLSGKGPFTVFAPSDEAFATLGQKKIAELLKPENKATLTAILTYHVVPGNLPAGKVVASKGKSLTTVQGCTLDVTVSDGGVMVGTANVVATDVQASNGVIHVIDSVLLPPKNLVAVAAEAGSFQTLLTAATAAGLADTLANGGPFTVFAPTDEAFAKLGKDTIANLLKPENKAKLADILKLHVVSGRVTAAEVVKLTSATTLGGKKVEIQVDAKNGTVKVGGVNVVKTDVQAGNGVIHVIDAVILPS